MLLDGNLPIPPLSLLAFTPLPSPGSRKSASPTSRLFWRSSTQAPYYQCVACNPYTHLYQGWYWYGGHQIFSPIIGQHLSIQSTRRYPKKNGLKAVVKQKKPLLRRDMGRINGTLLWPTRIGLWWTGGGLCGQMRSRLIVWALIEGCGLGKGLGRTSLTGWCRECKSLVEVHSWFGAVCCGKGLDMLQKLMGRWMQSFTHKFWRMINRRPCTIMAKIHRISFFNRIMTPCIPANWPRIGSKPMGSSSWHF